MRSFPLKYFVFIIITILLSGCNKDYIVDQEQKILFQYSYTNWAWAPYNQGLIICNDGNVVVYDNPKKWNFPDSHNKLTRDKVEENLSYCTPTDVKIETSELQKYVNLIDNFASSKISAPVSRGADIGTYAWLCYQFSKDSLTYKEVAIKIEGDLEYQNLNYFTKRTIEWIDGIRAQLPR